MKCVCAEPHSPSNAEGESLAAPQQFLRLFQRELRRQIRGLGVEADTPRFFQHREQTLMNLMATALFSGEDSADAEQRRTFAEARPPSSPSVAAPSVREDAEDGIDRASQQSDPPPTRMKEQPLRGATLKEQPRKSSIPLKTQSGSDRSKRRPCAQDPPLAGLPETFCSFSAKKDGEVPSTKKPQGAVLKRPIVSAAASPRESPPTTFTRRCSQASVRLEPSRTKASRLALHAQPPPKETAESGDGAEETADPVAAAVSWVSEIVGDWQRSLSRSASEALGESGAEAAEAFFQSVLGNPVAWPTAAADVQRQQNAAGARRGQSYRRASRPQDASATFPTDGSVDERLG